MKPILFDKSATSFTTNGIGRLDPISCQVIEERNGQYELEMEISLESQFADQIQMSSIIVVKPAVDTSLQAFRVYDIEKPINGRFVVHANHISYQLNYTVVMPFSVTASGIACASALEGLKTHSVGSNPFVFSTDVTTVAPYNQKVPQGLRACLGGVEGSILDQFGGEYEFDNYNVILHSDRGVQEPSVILRYGKDITDISQEENIEDTITGIVPFWVDQDGANLVTLPEQVVESSHASQYPFRRNVPMDFSGDFDEQPTVAQLRSHAQAYINRAGIGVPKVSIKVSFIDLSQTEEYKNLLSLQSIKLCDVIGIHFEKLDIDTTAKVVKVVYDCLKERYDSIEIGSVRTNLSHTINDTNASVTALANSTESNFVKMSNSVQESVDNATAWLTSSGGYVVAVKNQDGSWKELLFLDDNDIEEAVNVLRINENGIGFSSNGVAGPYTQAWTLDGRLVIGGTNVPSITVYDSNEDIIFQASADAMIWNADNSSMDDDGYITMNGATIRNGEITMIGSNSWLYIVDGEIHGGYGTTVGQNETYITFDNIHNNQPGNIRMNGRWLFLSLDGVCVAEHKGDNTGYDGYNGRYITDLLYTHEEWMNNFDVDWDTFYNVTTDLDIRSDSQGNISWSYNSVDIKVPYNFSWNDHDQDVCGNHTYRTMVHGIGT